ncbi:hypothetical protein ADN00_05640 [Ornatilinea apprima]|uniref:Uncharacterized protein n=1 Tax=Ornatilinea apprima TaxID=1134406 RepID=A0A0P6XEW4_9CHLR|nr:hypothetical protein [Ornatilinea apprima]KPL78724.1 hypothetical protein ADN00_05640 [Ornatilinea apprima]
MNMVVVGLNGSDGAIQSIMQGEVKAASLQPVAERACMTSQFAPNDNAGPCQSSCWKQYHYPV